LPCAATRIVVFGSKFVTTMLNTSTAPLVKVWNVGSNLMLSKPGFPVSRVHET
jgi:hypothetical protein